MLVLTRKCGEAIWVGDDVRIVVGEISERSVKLAIDAPKHVKILREELKDRGDEKPRPNV